VLTDPAVVVRDAALSIVSNGHSLRSDRWAYMRYQDQSEELYDMDADPNQFVNLARREQHEPVLREFRQRMQAVWPSSRASRRRRRSKKGQNHERLDFVPRLSGFGCLGASGP
jgi:iduronate 2-sulfatase